MPELMEECQHVIHTQQCGLVACRRGEVAHDCYNRGDLFSVNYLVITVASAPCTLTLALTRVKVHIKNTHMAAVSLFHLESLCLRMGKGNIIHTRKGDAIKLCGNGKRTAYTDCVVEKVGDKYESEGEAKRDLTLFAVDKIKE